jgi:CubicO group peptidase (beta-lactamase class C family)
MMKQSIYYHTLFIHQALLIVGLACLIIVSGLAVSAPSVHAAELDLDLLDVYIRENMETFEVPAMAVAIVQGNDVIFQRTYGVRDEKTGEPVDEDTLFVLGSVTKSMLAVAFANLVDQGRVAWDDTIITYLPDLKLSNQFVKENMTIRDLLAQRSGFPFDFAYVAEFAAGKSLAEIVDLIQYMPVSTDHFRKAFFYSNFNFTVTSRVLEESTGKPFSDAMDELVFEPLGMSDSFTDYEKAMQYPNKIAVNGSTLFGQAHLFDGYVNIEGVAGAGAALSTLTDFARYLQFHMNTGVLNGQQIISATPVEEMHTVQLPISNPAEGGPTFEAWFPEGTTEIVNAGYGLGTIIFEYHGKKVVWHGGQAQGGDAMFIWMPEEQIGAVVLSNMFMNDLTESVFSMIFNPFVGLPQEDQSERFLAVQQHKDDPWKIPEPAEKTPYSLELDAYAGSYASLSGDLDVTVSGDHLVFTMEGNGLTGKITPWTGDTFFLTYDEPGRTWICGQTPVTFHLENGNVVSFVCDSPFLWQKDVVTYTRQ